MTEKLLQYIWQYQYFDARNLVSVAGEKIQIISPVSYTHLDVYKRQK